MLEKIFDELAKVEGTVETGTKKMENSNNSIQNNIDAKDSATVINNVNGNPNDTKVQLILKIEDLKAEKQRYIDEQTEKNHIVYGTTIGKKTLYEEAAQRDDERIKSLENVLSLLH